MKSRPLAPLTLCAGLALAVSACTRRAKEASIPSPPIVDMARVAEPDPAVTRAVEEARAEVLRVPRSAAAWGRLGMTLLAHGAPTADSNACFAQAEHLDPKEARWPYFQGTSLLESDHEAAIAKLARAVELCGDRPDIVLLKLAETLLARGDLDEATAHFRRCLEATPGHPRATLGLARGAFLRGDLRETEERLVLAATDSRTRKAASVLLAEVRHRAGQRSEADRLSAEASEIPDDPPWSDPLLAEVERMRVGRNRSLTRAAALIRAGRGKEALAILQSAREQYPRSERVLLLLGLAHNMAESWAEGEKALREAVALAPNAPRAHYNLGLSLAGQQRHEEAAQSFQDASALMPTDAMALFQLGRCRAQLGDVGGTEQAFRAVLQARPAFADAHRELAAPLEQSGRRDEARKHLKQAVALNPGDAAAARLLMELEAAR